MTQPQQNQYSMPLPHWYAEASRPLPPRSSAVHPSEQPVCGRIREPRRGAIATCSRGMLGLITCDSPQPVNYGNGNKGVAWVGIHLTGNIGAPWSSREPEVCGHIAEVLELVSIPPLPHEVQDE